MFKVFRDLFRYDGRFRMACVFLGAVALMILLSFVSPDDPNKSFVVAMDAPPSLDHIFGISSQTCVPGTLVLMGRNGPPVGRPTFMSNVSNWLQPPFMNR